MSTGSVLEIHIAEAGARPQARESVEVTFIAAEEVDRFNEVTGESLAYGDLRRNVITQGVRLGELVGKTFSIGPATFQGIELCEPCAHLAATVNAKVLPHLAHTGLRAAILGSGTIHSGDTITSS